MLLEMKREMYCGSNLFPVDFKTRISEVRKSARITHCKYIKLKNWCKLEDLNDIHGNKQIKEML